MPKFNLSWLLGFSLMGCVSTTPPPNEIITWSVSGGFDHKLSQEELDKITRDDIISTSKALSSGEVYVCCVLENFAITLLNRAIEDFNKKSSADAEKYVVLIMETNEFYIFSFREKYLVETQFQKDGLWYPSLSEPSLPVLEYIFEKETGNLVDF